MSSTIIGASPSEGSSSKRISGLPTKVLAIESICCSPPESWPACLFFNFNNIGNVSHTLSIGQSFFPSKLFFFPKSIFSSTVCSGKTCLSSGT